MMVRAADALAEARRVGRLAGSTTVEAHWTKVARRIDKRATNHWQDDSRRRGTPVSTCGSVTPISPSPVAAGSMTSAATA